MININPDKINRILIIKLRGIGDVVLSTIVLNNLRHHFKNAKIDYLVEKPSYPILNYIPYVNDILFLKDRTIKSTLEIIFSVRKNKYDLVLDLFSNPRSAQITFFSNTKIRCGIDRKGRRYAYNKLITFSANNIHSAEVNLEFLKSIDCPVISKNLEYVITDNEKEYAKNYFKVNNLDNNKTVAVIPAGGWQSKRCEPEVYVKILKEIYKKYNLNFLILYGPDDLQDAKSIFSNTSNFSRLAPETTVREMVALISNCKATIANDSGPMHLSAAIGIPTLGIFGPTNPFLQGPYSPKSTFVRNEELECINCNLLTCPKNHECMLALPIEYVMKKWDELFTKYVSN